MGIISCSPQSVSKGAKEFGEWSTKSVGKCRSTRRGEIDSCKNSGEVIQEGPPTRKLKTSVLSNATDFVGCAVKHCF